MVEVSPGRSALLPDAARLDSARTPRRRARRQRLLDECESTSSCGPERAAAADWSDAPRNGAVARSPCVEGAIPDLSRMPDAKSGRASSAGRADASLWLARLAQQHARILVCTPPPRESRCAPADARRLRQSISARAPRASRASIARSYRGMDVRAARENASSTLLIVLFRVARRHRPAERQPLTEESTSCEWSAHHDEH